MKRTLSQGLVLLLLLALWELVPRLGLVNEHFLPPASSVLTTLARLLWSGELSRHLLVSLTRIVWGLGLAVAVACPLGLAMGWFRGLESVIDGPLQAGRQVSALALFPVFILFFGIGETSKVVIIFWAAVWPVLINTVAGVKSIEPLLIKSARSMGASSATILVRVVLPGSAPSVFTGVRLAAAYALMVLVAAEMVGANAGLGFLVLNSQETFKIPEMYAAIVSLMTFGLALNKLLLAAEHRATRWKELVHA